MNNVFFLRVLVWLLLVPGSLKREHCGANTVLSCKNKHEIADVIHVCSLNLYNG